MHSYIHRTEPVLDFTNFIHLHECICICVHIWKTESPMNAMIFNILYFFLSHFVFVTSDLQEGEYAVVTDRWQKFSLLLLGSVLDQDRTRDGGTATKSP